jgi:1,2-dihydroxy-3-keto-5-methylthiopentene dioxygenase
MSRLRIFDENEPHTARATLDRHEAIAEELAKVGVRFERWEANQPIAPGASQEEVIAAKRSDIHPLMRESPYQPVDLISIAP